jgi:hypothetical protein
MGPNCPCGTIQPLSPHVILEALVTVAVNRDLVFGATRARRVEREHGASLEHNETDATARESARETA